MRQARCRWASLPSAGYHTSSCRQLPASACDTQELHLEYNLLQGTLPKRLRCPALRILTLDNNQLEGSLPADLFAADSDNLETISLSFNKLSGRLPSSFRFPSKLQMLYLGDNLVRRASARVCTIAHNWPV